MARQRKGQAETASPGSGTWGAAAWLVAVTCFTFSPLAAEDGDLDKVLAAHLQAHGGAEKWEAVTAMRMEGTFEAFSAEAPFILHRKRPNLYHFQHQVLGAPTVLAFDGERPWVKSGAYGAPGGRYLGADQGPGANVAADLPFACPLLTAQNSGHPLVLQGRETVEGRDYWRLDIVSGTATPATSWYLDPSTGLEFKQVSRTYDVFSGNLEMEMETFYLDYRDTQGVVLPFRVEKHFGTRYHVLQGTSLELNPKVDTGLFRAPAGAAEPAASGP